MITFQPKKINDMLLINATCECDKCGARDTVVLTMKKRGTSIYQEIYQKPDGWSMTLTDATCRSCMLKEIEKSLMENEDYILSQIEYLPFMSKEAQDFFISSIPNKLKHIVYNKIKEFISDLKNQSVMMDVAAE